MSKYRFLSFRFYLEEDRAQINLQEEAQLSRCLDQKRVGPKLLFFVCVCTVSKVSYQSLCRL